jgi:hypothetical protein
MTTSEERQRAWRWGFVSGGLAVNAYTVAHAAADRSAWAGLGAFAAVWLLGLLLAAFILGRP